MKRNLLLILFIAASLASPRLFAQVESDSVKWNNSSEDTSEVKEWNWEWSDDNDNDKDHDFDFDEFTDFDFQGRPTLETYYGTAETKHKPVSSPFSKIGSVELRLGYTSLSEYEKYISKYRSRFVFGSNLSPDINSQSKSASSLTPEMWRFGAGYLEGYGYSFGHSAIVPYTSNSFVWTKLDAKDITTAAAPGMTIISKADSSALSLFNNSFRFGTASEGGLRIQIIPLFTLNAGYERTVVFPRHLFWKHLGSMAIEMIAIGAVDSFTREVLETSPAAAPIINFLLKNGLSYAIYELRKDKMNWPFKSAAPLTMDTWKLGLSFTF